MTDTDRSSGFSFSGFLGGLTVGMLAGVAGYYLLGTKEGKKVRERIQSEWVEAKTAFTQLRLDSNISQSTPTTEWEELFARLAKEIGFNRHKHSKLKPAPPKPTVFVKKTRPTKKLPTKFANA